MSRKSILGLLSMAALRPHLLFALAFVLASAGNATAGMCVDGAFGDDAKCDSRDIRIVDVVGEQVTDNGCIGHGDTVTLSGKLKVIVDLEDDDDHDDDGHSDDKLYDIGLFLGQDGEQALEGSCKVLTLPTAPSPFLDEDNDNCGDTAGDRTLLVSFTNLTVKCIDEDEDGRAELAACATWTESSKTSCSGPHNVKPGNENSCSCTKEPIDLDVPITGGNPTGKCDDDNPCSDDGIACTQEICDPDDARANEFGCYSVARNSRCDDGKFCNGAETCDANLGCRSGTAPNCNDNVTCTVDACNEDQNECTHTANNNACSDGKFCNGTETCTSTGCKPATQRACSANDDECTTSTCNETTDTCNIVPHHDECDDDNPCTTDTCDIHDGCRHVDTCNATTDAVCRSAGFWGTHGGFERGADNLIQDIIDTVGDIEVCGITISATVNDEALWVEDLGLSSALEGLCVKAEGEKVRQLYRQLIATALNCALSGAGDSCDDVLASAIDVSFDDCSDLCTTLHESFVNGVAGHDDDDDELTTGQCIQQLDCFNKGGRMIDGKCARGTCSEQEELFCGFQYPACPEIDGDDQRCRRFEDSCASEDLCQEELGICPDNAKASSPEACREARNNDCTIDSCE
ncbi:MAG TPA: hypothetical protein VEC57_08010 [Candidatus Limnocylindrales bacterium]|nr:hypothetical protein [Candidatus Limnocylindrales bacterium]